MGRIVGLILLTALCRVGAANAAEPVTVATFAGNDNDSTAVFETGGPWLADWVLTSEQPGLALFEIQLYDADTGEYLGSPVDVQGTGNGIKLFDRAGRFRLGIVARQAEWRIEVSEVSSEDAAELRRRRSGQPSLEDAARDERRRVPEGSFESWRADDERGLTLFGPGGRGYRVTFMAPCRGLESASAISFVTPARGSLQYYDSILLDDGTRCFFDTVTPTITD